MKFPSILVVGNFLTREGGTTQVCEELSQRLRQAGHVVTTTSGRKCRIARLGEMLYTSWRYRSSYDVAQIAVFSGASFIWAEAVCNLLKAIRCPFVLTLHGGGLPEFARKANRRVRRLLDSAAAVTVPSTYLFDKMRRYRSDLTLIPNALSRAKTMAEARRYGIETHLEMRSLLPKNKVPCVLKSADIFLNTSSIDNTPVSVLEAMAAGLCVVSTNVGGLPYLLESGREAFLVRQDDDAAMAAAVRLLLRDQQLARNMRIAAFNKVRKFDWRVVLPQWQDLLTSVALSKPQRSVWRPFRAAPSRVPSPRLD